MKPFIHSAPYAEAPILLCLDLQREHTTPPEGGERASRCVDACKRILRHARAVGWHVAHVQRHEGRIAALPERLRPIDGLEPRPKEPVFYRERPSAYASPAFDDFVTRLGKPRLIVIGFSLEASVLFTAVSSLERGIPVTLVDGASAPLGGDLLESVLFTVLGGFAEIVTPDELLDASGLLLLQAANHA
jgi:nicotinamidase-related amidase